MRGPFWLCVDVMLQLSWSRSAIRVPVRVLGSHWRRWRGVVVSQFLNKYPAGLAALCLSSSVLFEDHFFKVPPLAWEDLRLLPWIHATST